MSKYQPRHAAPVPPRRGVRRLAMTASLSAAIVAPVVASTNASAATSSDALSVLAKIKHCESGGNYTVVNSIGAAGAYQFMPATWRALSAAKGYATPQSAPPSVQDAAALELYNQMGTRPWDSSKSCWSKLGAVPATVTPSVAPKVASAQTVTAPQVASSGTVSRAAARTTLSASPAPSFNGVIAPASTKSGAHEFAPRLSAGWASNPFTGLKLNAQEQQAVNAATAVQKAQPEWSTQARQGLVVHRRVFTSGTAAGIPVLTHTKPNWYGKSVSTVASGTELVGKYVSIDWFQITRGAHAGEYIQTAQLHRTDLPLPKLGELPASSLAVIPNFLRNQPSTQVGKYLNPQALKQLVWMNAAWRVQFGTDLKMNESYRTAARQRAIYANLGPAVAAAPGTSAHELALAIDIASVTKGGSVGSKWMNVYSSAFGFQRPTVFDRTTTEWWHFNYVG